MNTRNFRTFSLFSMWSGKYLLQIQCVVARSGGFKNRSKIVLRNRKQNVSYRDHKARGLAKKRGLGYHRISFYHKDSVMHHVTKNCVVATPAYIHQSFCHSLKDSSAMRLEGVLG